MLSSEFSQEMGALVRRLQNRVILEPAIRQSDEADIQERLEQAIVALCALYISNATRRDV